MSNTDWYAVGVVVVLISWSLDGIAKAINRLADAVEKQREGNRG